jgi:hypothetical protein
VALLDPDFLEIQLVQLLQLLLEFQVVLAVPVTSCSFRSVKNYGGDPTCTGAPFQYNTASAPTVKYAFAVEFDISIPLPLIVNVYPPADNEIESSADNVRFPNEFEIFITLLISLFVLIMEYPYMSILELATPLNVPVGPVGPVSPLVPFVPALPLAPSFPATPCHPW